MRLGPLRLLVCLPAVLFLILSSLGCSSSSGPSESNRPLASIDSPDDDATIIEGGSVTFEGSASGGTPPYTYAWDFDGGAANSTAEDPGDVVFTAAGTYRVTLTATDSAGASDSSTVEITVVGPIAYYPFNGNADDESINDNDGTVTGATLVADRFDNDDSAYSFNGAGNFIQTPLDSNTLPLSFSVWFRASDISGDRSIVDSDAFGLNGHSLIIGWWNHDGDLHIEYHNSSIDSDFPVEVDVWYHAVVCFSDVIQLYVNGVQVGDDHDYPAVNLDGDTFRFGSHNPFDRQWYAGVIDDVRFYDRVLTQEDVLTLYSEGGWTRR